MNSYNEEFAFKIFRELHGNLPDGEKSESPDFIINLDCKRIGIELTELMEEDPGPLSLAAKYSLEDKISKSAQRQFDNRSDKRIMVNLQIVQKLNLSSHKINHLGSEIAQILIKATKDYPNVLSHHHEINENLPKEILNIYFDITPFMTESHFSVIRGKWTDSFNLNDLNRIIIKKDKYALNYRLKVDKLYLLIIEGFAPNSWYGPFTMTGSIIENNFDKIFLLKIMSRQLYEIK
ncbi:MAG: hypothetical protein ABSF81_10495 [Bacteroidales bacterium]